MQSAKKTTRKAVCICTDRRMLIPALFVAHAVKSHAPQPRHPFDVIIFAEPSEVMDVHRRWMKERDIILCEDMDMSRLKGICTFTGRLSVATLMKLSLAEHLAGQYDKILYLDCDLTIHEDISSIFSLETTPYALAAVPSGRILVDLDDGQRTAIEDSFRNLGMTWPYRFFNTGVLLIDVARWNREKLGHRALDFIRQNPDLCTLPDEHAINAVLDGNMASLSPVWNSRPAPRWRKPSKRSFQPVIIHYTGNDKPWRRFTYDKPLFPDLHAYRLYKDFLKDSPWPNWLNEQWRWKDLIANIVFETRRLIIKTAKGNLREPSKAKRKAYHDAFLKFCEEIKFADVEQGIVHREKADFRLKKQMPG